MKGFLDRLIEGARYAGVGERQTDIAHSLGVKVQTVNRWFRGGYVPGRDMLKRIEERWKISADWLIYEKGQMLPPTEQLPDDERELLRDYRAAAPKMREAIKRMVHSVRKAVVFVAATIPPFLLPPQETQGATLHKQIFTTVLMHIGRRFSYWRLLDFSY